MLTTLGAALVAYYRAAIAPWQSLNWVDKLGVIAMVVFLLGGIGLFLRFVISRCSRSFPQANQDRGTSVLTLRLDPTQHRTDDGWESYWIYVKNNRNSSNRTRVHIKTITPIPEDADREDILAKFADGAVMPAAQWDRNTELPPAEINIPGDSEVAFVFVAFGRGQPSSLRVCHCRYAFGILRTGTGVPLRMPTISDETIPLGKYCFQIGVHGADGSDISKSFIITATNKPTFTVTEERR